jgi:hypothetical protein
MPDATTDLVDTWNSWARAMGQGTRLPLAGDVSQWIRAWGEAVAQIGLVNINVEGSADPQFERDISRDYTYGRQLGRMLDVLLPLAESNEADLRKQIGNPCFDDFTAMARDIQRRKQARKTVSVDRIVSQVADWRDRPGFANDLQALIERLQALAPKEAEAASAPRRAAASAPARPQRARSARTSSSVG